MKNLSWTKVRNIYKMYYAEQGKNTCLALLLMVTAVIMFQILTLIDYDDNPDFISFMWKENVSRIFSFYFSILFPSIVMLFLEKFFYKGKLISKLTLPAKLIEKYLGLALIFFKYNIMAVIFYIVLAVTWLVYFGINNCHFTAYQALSDITSRYLLSWLITQIFIFLSFFYAFVSSKTDVLRRAVSVVAAIVIIMVYFIMTFIILPQGEPVTITVQAVYVLIFSVFLLIQGYNNFKNSYYEE